MEHRQNQTNKIDATQVSRDGPIGMDNSNALRSADLVCRFEEWEAKQSLNVRGCLFAGEAEVGCSKSSP